MALPPGKCSNVAGLPRIIRQNAEGIKRGQGGEKGGEGGIPEDIPFVAFRHTTSGRPAF